MNTYREHVHQESVRKRLRSRDNGFAPFALLGDETIGDMFSRQVQLHARKPAIVSGGKCLTYEELDRVSSSISRAVGQEMEGSKTPIAILATQHTNFVASILGVLKSSRFYVPLDPSFPESRNSRILRDSQARIVLTERANQKLAERLALPEQTLLYLEEIGDSHSETTYESKPDDLACVIFTSGSTGYPKGVMQTQRNVLQVVKRYTNSLYVGHRDRVSLLSSCSVTASVATLLGSLLNGATLSAFSVLGEGLDKLANWLDDERITLYDSAPSLFRHLMRSTSPERVFTSIQIVRLVSDSTYKSDWDLFTRYFPEESVLVNNYGCSEMSTVAGFYTDKASVLADGALPVGYPLQDVDISLIDSDGKAISVSELEQPTDSPVHAGEIVLKSSYLSPGYWNDPSATIAAFSADANGVRVYRTGDIGLLRGDQGLVHLGREDLQVKLSGFRVEIAEVEALLRSSPAIKEAAILLHTPDHGERELLGFVEVDSNNVRGGSEIRSYLQDRLPAHMVPSEIVIVDQIPCTPNGKIDRSSLLKLREHAWNSKARQAPQTLTEEILTEIWRKLLVLHQIGVDDNFFELGGNSLLGMRLVSNIAETFKVNLSIVVIFQYSTIRELARLVERSLPDDGRKMLSTQAQAEEGAI